MKRVLVLGTGYVVKPLVDYFIDKCKYEVLVASRDNKHSGLIVAGRALGNRVLWSATPPYNELDEMVKGVDLVVSMIPPNMHVIVANVCLKHGINMVTTSYISPEMKALDEKVKKAGIIVLNEIGEDPGIDHMGAMKMINQVKKEGGKIKSFKSYGSGIPSFEHNNNPYGYKFSWSPRGLLTAAQTPATYIQNGQKIEVSGENLFESSWLVDVEGLGTFETYPNRDSTNYIKDYGLEDVSDFYRGLLRHPGYCNSMQSMKDLNLLSNEESHDLQGVTYKQFTALLIGASGDTDIKQAVSDKLNLKTSSDIIKQLQWLGLFDDEQIPMSKGTNADVLLGLMQEKMTYKDHEKDMIIVHNEAIVEFDNRMEKRIATMKVEGRPFGHSAMSRAVGLPAAIASRLILEGTIRSKGVLKPITEEIYKPILSELAENGYKFEYKTQVI
ncbi:MAG TPA: saccharopine dehydrogenase [Candidatus Marinimicrobia bacterium]|jgi:saccharopine dehydrogenase-like NADP-dependent oxidoreductase|nr:saccharopine dehydrogenase [Candidatus Neomarinimicrobiota bacterium]